MKDYYLSYLIGAGDIKDSDLTNFGIVIEEKKADGDRTLKIPEEKLSQYVEIIKAGLSNGFWNEIVGTKEIIFIFRFKDGSVKEYRLPSDNEWEINKLCAEFNGESPGKTDMIYKYLSENKFYHDFMLKHYADKIPIE